MRINTKFPVAVHILTTAAFCRERPATSELIAKSVNTNPVVIRRLVAMLKQAGLVEVRSGVGGVSLRLPPEEITLLAVYNAVRTPGKEDLFDLHQEPNEACPIGANIHEALSEPLLFAQREMERGLERRTLYDVMKTVAESSGLPLGEMNGDRK